MKEEFQYISEDTLEDVYLHDSTIINISIKDNNLIWELDSIEILPEHPCNQTSSQKNTEEVNMVFYDYRIESIIKCTGFLFDGKTYKPTNEEKAVNYTGVGDMTLLKKVFDMAEILNMEKISEKEGFHHYEILLDSRDSGGLSKIFIKFTKVIIRWNNYI